MSPTTQNEQQNNTPPKEKIKTCLTGTPATALIAVYGRHLESQLPPERRLLNDTYATDIVSRIDYPFSQLRVGGGTVAYIGMRGAQLDGWVSDFIKRNPAPRGCTVVNLACGLDSRALRLIIPAQAADDIKVRWIDVDLPEVVELREQVVVPYPSSFSSSFTDHHQPERRGKQQQEVGKERSKVEYTLLPGSVTDAQFITSLPNDRPTMIVMEGLSAYLQPEEGQEMIHNLCSHFGKPTTGGGGSGGENEMIFEAINGFTLALQGLLGYLKRTEAAVYWGIDDAKSLEKLHEGLVLVEEHPVCGLKGVVNSPLAARVFWWLCSWFEVSRNSLRHLRYVF
ncbi:S-adenosyl-L-methionine-dependent methyltransferase [Rhypophila sp. PSN 637]